MKQYPSIGKTVVSGAVYAFDKFDGSNLRVEWSRKNGFHRWGRRHGLLDDFTPILKRAPDIFDATLSTVLNQVYRDERWESCTTFLEFWGWNSFAGNHDQCETQFVSVFDIDVYKRGILDPKSLSILLNRWQTFLVDARHYYIMVMPTSSLSSLSVIGHFLECHWRVLSARQPDVGLGR